MAPMRELRKKSDFSNEKMIHKYLVKKVEATCNKVTPYNWQVMIFYVCIVLLLYVGFVLIGNLWDNFCSILKIIFSRHTARALLNLFSTQILPAPAEFMLSETFHFHTF
jgi:hypothetical protein